MSFNDPVADLLTRIRNAIKAKMAVVYVGHSILKESIVKILKEEGFIVDYSIEKNPHKTLIIKLKYKGKICSIQNLKQISRPSLRVYSEAEKLPSVLNNLGIAIVSTSQGLLTSKKARKQNIGGEVLAYVW